MTLPIALQLYTVREALTRDFPETIRRIADLGYSGVETAGFPGVTPEAAAALFRDLELTVAGAHAPLPLGEQKNQVLDTMSLLNCRRLIYAGMRPEHYGTADAIRRTADQFNEANTIAQANGLSFGVHNHWWEFEPVDGRLAYQILLDHLEPTVFFEIDTYWIQTAGVDPVQVLRELGDRVPLLHIKDGPAVTGEPQVALGDGTMAFEPIMDVAQETAEWLVVELDEFAGDMMSAVADSYRYLVKQGYGHGTQS